MASADVRVRELRAARNGDPSGRPAPGPSGKNGCPPLRRNVTEEAGKGVGEIPGPEAPPPAIRMHGLTRDFPSVRAVDGLSLEVPAGTVFGFLGPNGAGKTTTIRLLLGLLAPTAGEARVLGYDCRTESDRIRRRTGVLLTDHGLLERLTARDNLELFGRIARMPAEGRRDRSRELLRRLGLWERRDERVAGWSRGMKQKLAVARALMHRPRLLFLDEPTSGLDPLAAAMLREELAELASREGVTVFLTTHNLAEVEKLCDRVAVVRRGRLLAVGTPEDIRARTARTRLRITGRGFTDNVVELVGGRTEVREVTEERGGILLELRDAAPAAPIVACLVRLGVRVEEVTRVRNSLEEAFLSVVRGEARAGDSWLVRPPPGSDRRGDGAPARAGAAGSPA